MSPKPVALRHETSRQTVMIEIHGDGSGEILILRGKRWVEWKFSPETRALDTAETWSEPPGQSGASKADAPTG